ncbi:MAG: YbaN family protein [Gammaproteobacteria bacterium]
MVNSPDAETDPPADSNDHLVAHRGLRTVLFTIGGISLALGVIGIFLPLLPTTPFLLLTAACYLRSSPRFYHWLLSHPVLSKYLLAYLDGKGIPRRAKIYTTLPLWISLLFSSYLVPLTWVRIGLLAIGVAVTIYIWRLPELQPASDQQARR